MLDNLQKPKYIVMNIVVTAGQAFLATWAATGNKTDKACLGASVGAVSSAAWNLILKPAIKSRGWL